MFPESPRIVYSTATGKIKPGQNKLKPDDSGVIRVFRDAKYRRGKEMTIITGIPLSEAALLKLAKYLKQKYGTGGTVKDGKVELQGDHRAAVVEELKKQGFAISPKDSAKSG